MGKTNPKLVARMRRRQRIRKRLRGSNSDRMRLAVFRSARHIYAQIIDDSVSQTVVAVSSCTPEIRQMFGSLQGKRTVATEVGRLLAQRAQEKGIRKVAFDRGGFLYHGRMKALAEGVREGGLEL